jgi:tetratricopeptide (TPR) repeat protein
MNVNIQNKKRHIIPRWRPFKSAVTFGDISSYQPHKIHRNASVIGLDEAHQAWEENNTIETASELLGAALVCGDVKKLIEPAKYIVSNKTKSRKPVVDLALVVLTPKSLNVIDRNENSSLLLPDTIMAKIKTTKHLLSNWPKLSTAWVDLARLYVIMGENNKAIRAMNIALYLDEKNRFIVRSAVRMHVHLSDPTRALYILKKSGQVRHDPWILAADIAVNTILEKSSIHINTGIKLIDRNTLLPRHVSELSSAIGTVELNNGALKKAKKYFKHSLRCPNDNTLAQAEWASHKIRGINTANLNNIPSSFEANTQHAFTNNQWDRALRCCYKWAWDEPFSISPAAAGSFISESIFQDHKQAIAFCKQGLRSNRDDNGLINNLVFSLACSGKLDAAKKEFKKIKNIDKNSNVNITITATSGLINYRDGNTSQAREFYEQAIKQADESNRMDLKAIAAIYAAREEKMSKGGKGDEYYKRAVIFKKSANDPIVDGIANCVLGLN